MEQLFALFELQNPNLNVTLQIFSNIQVFSFHYLYYVVFLSSHIFWTFFGVIHFVSRDATLLIFLVLLFSIFHYKLYLV